jgi:hypothetical protein
MEADAVYFARRASEERAAAMRAVHLKARQAHREMASRYQDLATSIGSPEGCLGFHVAGVA